MISGVSHGVSFFREKTDSLELLIGTSIAQIISSMKIFRIGLIIFGTKFAQLKDDTWLYTL